MPIWNQRKIKKLKNNPNDYPWDDLRFPAQGINPPGAASDPDIETSTGLLLFSGTSTEIVAGAIVIPHTLAVDTLIDFHVHWQKTTSAGGNVLWRIDYEVVNNGDVATMAYGTQIQSTSPIAETPDNDTANEILITDIGDVDMTGKKLACMVLWKLSRIGGDGSDTYNSDARLLEMDIHYQKFSDGSYDEWTSLEKEYAAKKGKPKKPYLSGAW
ncbi:hypothetical protein LCGC14_1394540 [marine sediment metagenome]|uniref:Uncharacterized protein n=1 Tax=marine sediment metagenome TaxID=412755 RepID=A0A0F9N0G9_9ZZZZ